MERDIMRGHFAGGEINRFALKRRVIVPALEHHPDVVDILLIAVGNIFRKL